MHQVSVVIITWNAERYIKNCLDSVLEATKDILCEIIIVDNGSVDKTMELLLLYKKYPNFQFIFEKENLGVSKARNKGILRAKGRYIWILDIDTVVNAEALHTMLRFIESTPDCGMCACKQLSSDGIVQDSCRKFPALRFKLYTYLEVVSGRVYMFKRVASWAKKKNEKQFYHLKIKENKPFEVEYVIGANQLIRKETVDETGLLDEKIFYGPEDADYCLRMGRIGWKIYYLPQVTIVHEYQRITNKKIISPMAIKHLKALIYFFIKHKRI